MRTIVAIAVFTAVAFYLVYRVSGGDDGTSLGQKLLFVAPGEQSGERLGAAIASLERTGFEVITDPGVPDFDDPELVAFMTTRARFGDVPESAWHDLYNANVLVGGLDVSSSELSPLVAGMSADTPTASSSLPYSADQAIFSFRFLREDCGRGTMSDWLQVWPNLGEVIHGHIAELRSGDPEARCRF